MNFRSFFPRTGLFLFAFAGLTSTGGYLATQSSRDASCCVGSLNNSGIAVKECARHSRLKSQSPNISWGMPFEQCRPSLRTAVALDQ